MKNNNTPMRKSLSFATLLIGAAVVSGICIYSHSHTKKYISGIKPVIVDHDKDAGAEGMMEYFYNARKNIATGQMDYGAMAAANIEDQKMTRASNATARTEAGLSMTWEAMGPSNIGGRTRGILVDNRDPSGNTLFATAVSGGIWKSTNAGGIWDSVAGNDTLSSLNACDIAQDKNGVLYVGTGEGFSIVQPGHGYSSGMIGGGIFKSTDDGNTWKVLPLTVPPANNNGSTWSYVNRIAVDPNNPNYVYAATYKGLQASQDGGNTWTTVKSSVTHAALNGQSLDVKISADGSLLLTTIGGIAYYTYPSGPVTEVTPIPASANGGGGTLPSNGIRLEIAISPSNPNYAYISFIRGFGTFGSGATKGTGIYMTMTAKTNGGYWYNIGPGGSNTFDPYSSGGSQDQGTYDNVLAVSPANPGLLFVGGTVLWSWKQQFAGDTLGGWVEKSSYFGFPYIHPDEHAITFSSTNPSIIYDGNDGGIYKSYDNGDNWTSVNRNYNVTQYNSIAFAPYMSTPASGYTVGEGVMGGTQDNGTPYINGKQYYYEDAVDLSGGDGGKSAMSQLDPNVYFVTTDNDALIRGANLSTLGSPASAYTSTIGDSSGANIDSVSTLGGCFYHQIALYENPYDTNTLDSMIWIADTDYSAGKTVYPVSPNGNIPFPYKLKKNVTTGDTLKIKNVVVSKIATGFTEKTGVWMMMQAIDVSTTPLWMPIGGLDSKPDAFPNSSSVVHSLAWSPDGDALFVGFDDGRLYRLSNLDSVIDDQYLTGALFGMKHAGGKVINAKCRVISTLVNVFPQDILSISVDPKNGNKVLVTLANYGSANYVYYSSNALGASPTFATAQGNLPKMPVYSSVLDVVNSGQANSALVGTERGVYSTININAASPTWTKTSTGLANTLVMGLAQQTLPPWNCNNAYNVYAGTHGRGAFVSNSFYEPLAVKPITGDIQQQITLNIYPNPMTTQGTIAFDLPKNGNVTVKVYDLNGRLVENIPMDNQSQGHHQVSLNTENYSTGTYIATVTGNGFIKSARFVVVK